jgi:ADP-ribose pyrophosphatase YjhB (NUDIX family)
LLARGARGARRDRELSARPVVHAVAGILRRGDEIVLVREAGEGEEPAWAIPGGMLDDQELLTDGLAREVHEETGLEIGPVERLAFVSQVDVRERDRHPGPYAAGYFATIWTFEVASFAGELGPRDPDGFVLEAALVPLPDALVLLESGPKAEGGLVGPYLRGEVEPGSVHAFRRHEDGRLEAVSSVPP